MVKKKLQEIREQNDQELIKVKADLQSKMRTIRFQTKIERPANPLEKRNLRKKVAVINTILRERELKK